MDTVCFAMHYIVCVFLFLSFVYPSFDLLLLCYPSIQFFSPSAPELVLYPSFLFCGTDSRGVPVLIPFVHPRRLVIFESREPRR